MSERYEIKQEYQELFQTFMEILPDTRNEKLYFNLSPSELTALGAETIASLLLPSRGALVKFKDTSKVEILAAISEKGSEPEIELFRRNLKTKNDEIKSFLKEIEKASPDVWKKALILVCMYQSRDKLAFDEFLDVYELESDAEDEL